MRIAILIDLQNDDPTAYDGVQGIKPDLVFNLMESFGDVLFGAVGVVGLLDLLGVLGNSLPQVLPPIEIDFSGRAIRALFAPRR
jgi:hypothetical protein